MKHCCLRSWLLSLAAAPLILGCTASSGQFPPKEGTLQELRYTPASSHFSLWAPTADSARVLLYEEGLGGQPYEVIEMNKNAADGSWSAVAEGDLEGRFYTFRVNVSGRWLEETPGIFATAVGVNGQRAAVVDFGSTDPEGWAEDRRPELRSFADAVVYEMHHRDFSISGNSGISPEHRGKFLALTETGTRGPRGVRTGVDHLVELGVTHVHILPSFDYASVDETRLEDNVYNWGYDPVNYNVPDGSYSTDPYDPACRIREFKEMVQALHKAGIRVVLDVVYNHVSDAASQAFERTVPGYFFRMREDGSFADGSACGNETASDREMMRRFMVESVCWWVEEYHIDGFRFDLMGIHDIRTMNEVRAALTALDPSIIVYGEGWAAQAPQLPQDSLAMKANTYRMPGIAAFSDEMRDALRGPFNDNKQGAFLAGLPGGEESIKFGIVGAVQHPQVCNDSVNYSQAPWAGEPTQMISYVSCHDDMCLVDRLRASIPGIKDDELARLDKLAQTAVFTSQGIPFIYAGEEVMRDKKGVHNSYQSPDSINAIDWSRKALHADVFAYYKGLIQLRKNHPAFRLDSAELVRRHLEFLPVEGKNLVAWRLKEHAGGDRWEDIVVVLNSRREPARVAVPQGNYTIVCKDGAINEGGLAKVSGAELTVSAQSALIAWK